MGEVYYLVSTLKSDVQSLSIGGHSLVKSDSRSGEFPLQAVHALLEWSEVEEAHLGVFARGGEASNHTLGDVVGSVHNYELHCARSAFN